MATNDDGQRGGPPRRTTAGLQGLTFLDDPGSSADGGGETWQLKRADGTVEGPYSIAQLASMVQAGRITGDEGVSRDGAFWVPMTAVPELTGFVRGKETGRTLAGPNVGLDALGNPRSGATKDLPDGLPQPEGFGVEPSSAVELPGSGLPSPSGFGVEPSSAAPLPTGPSRPSPGDSALFGSSLGGALTDDGPAPLGASGFGEEANTGHRMASGAWGALPGLDDEDLSVSRAVAPSADALSGLPGVRKLSQSALGGVPSAPMGGLELEVDDADVMETSSLGESLEDLPMSASAADPFADLPASAGFEDLPASAGAGPRLPSFTSGDLPAVKLDDGVSELPGRLDELPRPAGSTAELPGSVHELPQRAGELPQTAGQLPRSAAELPDIGPTAPASTSELPDLPPPSGNQTQRSSAGPPRHATMAMSGITGPPEPELPGRREDVHGPAELPTSRGGNTLLDDLADADDLWADDAGVLPGGDEARTGAAFDLDDGGDPFDFSDEPFEAPASDGDGLGAFFDSDDAEPAMPAGPALPETPAKADAAPDEKKAKKDKKAKKEKKSSGGGGGALKAIAAIVVVGALAGGGYFAMKTLQGGREPDTPDTTPETVEAPQPVVDTELPGLDTLATGSWSAYTGFVDAGAGAATPEDRADVVLALSLMLADTPDDAAIADQIESHVQAMGDAEGEAAALALGAWEAMQGDPAALDTLRAVRGERAAWGRLLEGLYHVQAARGVNYTLPELEGTPEDAAEGSGAPVAEGSADAPAVEEPPPNAPIDVVEPETFVLTADAARAFDAAIAADPNLVPARYWRGVVAMELGDPEAARGFFEQAVARNEAHVPSLTGIARAMLRSGELGEADGRIQRVIDELEEASAPHERGDTFLLSAEISVARMQPELAIESLLSALQADPRNGEALAMLGEQFYQAGQYQRAVEYFQSNADLGTEDPEVALELIKSQFGLGAFADASAGLEDAMTRFPGDARFPYFLGRVREEEANFDGARELYQQAIQIDPEFLRSYVRLAQLAEREGDPAEAIRMLAEASSVSSDSAVMANEIGETWARVGETNRAVASWRQALEIDSSFAEARINLTDYYLESGQHNRALDELAGMIESGVDSPRVRYLHARANIEHGRYDRSIEELRALIDEAPENANYMFELGRAHFFAGLQQSEAGQPGDAARSFQAAREQFVAAIGRSPSMQEATYYQGRADLELGNYNEAISSLTTVADRSANGAYHYWLGVALEQGGQPIQALVEFTNTMEDALAWSLENPEVYFRRGRLFYRRGALGRAYRDLRTVLTLRPDHAEAAWTMGRVFFEQREWEASVEMLEKSLALSPSQPLAHYYAGMAQLNRAEPQPEAALAHLTSAVEQGAGATRPDLFQRLGYVYRDLGQNEQAIESFRAYLEQSELSYDERRETENEIRRLGGQP